MVAGNSTFDSLDFSLPVRSIWYVHEPGWIRGPYSLEDMRRFRDLGWLSKSKVVSRDMQNCEPAGRVDELWSTQEIDAEESNSSSQLAIIASNLHWRYSVDKHPCDEPVSFATLQILASIGRLEQSDLVWREGWPKWRPACEVSGLISGPSEWCSACGSPLSFRETHCPECGARLPGFMPPHSELCIACGILGILIFPTFPLWLIAIILGSQDVAEIAKGRMDPRGQNAAQFGLKAGIVGGVLFLISGVIFAVIFVIKR